MGKIDLQTFRAIFPNATAELVMSKFPYVMEAMEWGGIVDGMEQCAFLAHLAHESGEFKYVREIADGSAYEGRFDLGNVNPNDGRRYRGRGDIQITGRDAARTAGRDLGAPFEEHPELMEMPEWASKVSAWFWTRYKPWLPYVARKGWFHVTQVLVNGGNNGWNERVAYYQRNLDAFGFIPYPGREQETNMIKDFQAAAWLVPDGQVGPATMKVLMKVRN